MVVPRGAAVSSKRGATVWRVKSTQQMPPTTYSVTGGPHHVDHSQVHVGLSAFEPHNLRDLTPRVNKCVCNVIYGGTSLIRNRPPPYDSTVGLCLGPYGGPGGGAFSDKQGTPVQCTLRRTPGVVPAEA